MKIRIDVTKRIAIAHVKDHCACYDCDECPAEPVCKSLEQRGLKHFEDLETYELQAIINRIDGVEGGKDK